MVKKEEEERGRERGNWNMEIEDIREMERERRGRKGMNKRDEKVKIRRYWELVGGVRDGRRLKGERGEEQRR